MKIMPLSHPAAMPQPGVDGKAQQAARDRVITMLTKGAEPTPQPVQQPSPTPVHASAPQQIDIETPSEELVEEAKPQEDPALSRQFAQLARQEKAFRAKAQQHEARLQAREAALAAKESELSRIQQPDLSKYIPKDRLQSNTWDVLAEEGINFDKLTNDAINQPQIDPHTKAMISRLEAKLANLEKAAEEGKLSQTEGQKQQYEAAVNQIRTDVKSVVKADLEKYEMIHLDNAYEDVVELIKDTYDKDGILMTVEEAAMQVEEYIADEILKRSKAKKIQTRMSPKPTEATSLQAKQTQTPNKQAQAPAMRTLTNSTSTQRQLSAKERALLAFKGEKF